MKKTPEELADFILIIVLDHMKGSDDDDYIKAINMAVSSVVSTLHFIGYMEKSDGLEIAKHIAKVIDARFFSHETDGDYTMYMGK